MKVKGHWSACRDECFWIFFRGLGGVAFFPFFFHLRSGQGSVSFGLFYSFFFRGRRANRHWPLGDQGFCFLNMSYWFLN